MTALSDGSDCLQLGQDESGQGLQTAPSNEIRLATVATAFSSGASQWQGPTSKFTLDQGTADDPDLSPPLSISASNVLRDTCAPGREYTPSLTATEVWSWPPSSRQSASSQKRAFPSGESGESSPGPKRRFGASLLEAPLTLDHRYLLCQVGALEGVRDLARGLSSRKPSTVVPSVDRRSCLRFRAPDPDAYAKSTSHRIMSEIQKAIRIANQALASPVNRDDCAHMSEPAESLQKTFDEIALIVSEGWERSTPVPRRPSGTFLQLSDALQATKIGMMGLKSRYMYAEPSSIVLDRAASMLGSLSNRAIFADGRRGDSWSNFYVVDIGEGRLSTEQMDAKAAARRDRRRWEVKNER